jgi:hypothetical protein
LPANQIGHATDVHAVVVDENFELVTAYPGFPLYHWSYMPIKVALQTIDNRKLEQIVPNALETVINDWLPFGDSAYPMLQYIDEYGDTIFNGLQMREFLEEWDRLTQTLTNPDQRKIVLDIRQLAEKCQRRPQTYLRFIGD